MFSVLMSHVETAQQRQDLLVAASRFIDKLSPDTTARARDPSKIKKPHMERADVVREAVGCMRVMLMHDECNAESLSLGLGIINFIYSYRHPKTTEMSLLLAKWVEGRTPEIRSEARRNLVILLAQL